MLCKLKSFPTHASIIRVSYFGVAVLLSVVASARKIAADFAIPLTPISRNSVKMAEGSTEPQGVWYVHLPACGASSHLSSLPHNGLVHLKAERT
jgi:hypothetical protein